MCLYFTHLNQVCPKETYPFFIIVMFIDKALAFCVLIFMDAYSGYHQIRMNPNDAL